jgi:hypothetical protein
MKTKILFYLVGSLLCFFHAANATNYYVTATGNGSGTSWNNALSNEAFIAKLASDIVDDDVMYMAVGLSFVVVNEETTKIIK